MLKNPPRVTRFMLLRGSLLGFAVLTSAAAIVVLGFVAYLIAEGYAGGNDPESTNGLLFPIAFVILGIVGVPLSFISAASWVGYFTTARKSRQLPR